MSSQLFKLIMKTVEDSNPFFQQRRDAAAKLGASCLSGVRDGSVVVRCCHTRSRAQVRVLGRLMVLFIPDSHLSEIRIMAVTTEWKDRSG